MCVASERCAEQPITCDVAHLSTACTPLTHIHKPRVDKHLRRGGGKEAVVGCAMSSCHASALHLPVHREGGAVVKSV